MGHPEPSEAPPQTAEKREPGVASRESRFLGERNQEHHEIFVGADARRVTFPCHVLRQQDAPGRELNLFPADDIDLTASADDDHVLAFRRRVALPHEAARPAQELRGGDLCRFRLVELRAQLCRPPCDLGVFGVRLTVGARIQPRDGRRHLPLRRDTTRTRNNRKADKDDDEDESRE